MEDKGALAERVEELWRGMKSRGDHLYTSALTLGEVLVKPSGDGAIALGQEYQRLLRHPKITVLPFDVSVAPYYARVRADRSIRPPDAIQLAIASAAEIDLFITNDERLGRKNIAGIKFITSLNRAPI
jgi:predicted nucleic acid-binding protein